MAKIEVLPPAQSKATEPTRPATEANVPPAQAKPAEPARPAREMSVPTFTLRASDPFELRALINIAHNVQALRCPPERVREMERITRGFELWEEAHRK